MIKYIKITINNGLLLLLTLSLANFSCTDQRIDDAHISQNNLGAHELIDEPTEEELIVKSKEFLRVYLLDYETFMEESESLTRGKYKAEFHNSRNRWYVFFTNGLGDYHVDLNLNGTLGNVYTSNGFYVSRLPNNSKADSPDTLFTLAEFKKNDAFAA